MKKILILVGGILILLLACLAILPLFFEGKAEKTIRAGLDKQITSRYELKEGSVDLSLLRHFPNLSISISELRIMGSGEFASDTVFESSRSEIVLSIFPLLSGKVPKVIKVKLENPKMNLKRVDSTRANWMIFLNEESINEESSGPSGSGKDEKIKPIALEIIEGDFKIRDDLKSLEGIFKRAQLNLVSEKERSGIVHEFQFECDNASLKKGSTKILEKQVLALELQLHQDDTDFGYEGAILTINDQRLISDGNFSFKEDAVGLNLSAKNLDSTFFAFLTMIPGIDPTALDRDEIEGEVSLNLMMEGNLGAHRSPKIEASVEIKNGRALIPRFTNELSGLNVEILFKAPEDSIASGTIEMKELKAGMGDHSIDIQGLLSGIGETHVSASINGELELSDIQEFYPVEETEMKGLLELELDVKGLYSGSSYPGMEGKISLSNGYIHPPDLDEPLRNLELKAHFSTPNGDFENSSGILDRFSFRLGDRELSINGGISNLKRFEHDLRFEGSIDLSSLNKLLPDQHRSIQGILTGNFSSKGSLKSEKAETPAELDLLGKIKVSELSYKKGENPLFLSKVSGNLDFRPGYLQFNSLHGEIGESDFFISGRAENYSGYLLNQETMIIDMDLRSERFFLDHFAEGGMKNEQDQDPESESDKNKGGGRINLDVTVEIDDLSRGGLRFQDIKGIFRSDENKLEVKDLNFNSLGGRMNLETTLDRSFESVELFDLRLEAKDVDIHQAFTSLNAVSQIAPVAEKMEGQANLLIDISGFRNMQGKALDSTITGMISIEIMNAGIQNFDLVKKMMSTVKVPGLSNWVKKEYRLSDFSTRGEVILGRFYFEPFKVVMNEHPFEFFGSYGLDGSLDYLVATEFKPEKLGTLANVALSTILGNSYDPEHPMEIDFKVSGDQKNPKVRLLSMNPKGAPGHYSDPMEEEKELALERKRKNSQIHQAYLEQIRKELEKRKN